MERKTGFEPATSTLARWRSTGLSYFRGDFEGGESIGWLAVRSRWTLDCTAMAVLVQKYGGTSVDGPERIRAVAQRIAGARSSGSAIVVVVSAMGHSTD